MPGDQPKNPKQPQLAPNAARSQHTTGKRFASTGTGANVDPVTTAHELTCVPPKAVRASTKPSNAQVDAHHHVRHDSHPHADPLPPSFQTASTLYCHSTIHRATNPHSPVNVLALERHLQDHPNHDFVKYLTQGFRVGFRVGYQGTCRGREATNLTSASSRPDVITEYIRKECLAGNTSGPFSSRPRPDLVVNPLGAVPKKGGKWRLIMHLSHPDGESVNDGIRVEDFPLKYITVYDAMDAVMNLGRNSLMAKLDVKSAFRLCPVHPADHPLLGMKWEGQYYYDLVLPFGLRSAPFTLAQAVEWITKKQGINVILHYLDDFFLAGHPESDECERGLHTLIKPS